MDIKSLMVPSGVFSMENVKATTKFRRHLFLATPHLPPARRKKLTNERGVRGAGGGWSYRAARSMRIFALNSNLISLYCHLEIVKICTAPTGPLTPLSGVEPTWAETKAEEASCFSLPDSMKPYYHVYPVLSVHIDI